MVRRLRARFAAAALKEGDDADDVDVQKEIQAIGVSSSLPSAASRALAPTRFGAPLPMFLRGRRALRRRFPLLPSPRQWPGSTPKAASKAP